MNSRDHPSRPAMTIGEWSVWPDRLELQGRTGTRKIEPLTMRLLLLLAEKAPETISRDDMIDRLWDGRAVSDDAVNKQLSKLRAALESGHDDKPYLRTVPRIGVRLVRPVEGPVIAPYERYRRKHLPWLAAAAGAAALAVAGMWLWLRPTEWELVQQPVTAIPGSEIEPALSPDGRWLAYVGRVSPGEPFALFVRPVGSDRSQRITAADVSARVPTWSNDGRIAFVRRSSAGCRIAIALTSGSYRDVAPCILAEIGGLAWLDSRRLIVSDHPGSGQTFRLSALDLATGQTELLVDPPSGDVGDIRPVVSADGETIYFLRNKSVGPSEVYSARLGSRRATKISADNAVINGLAPGPGGTLLVSSQRGGMGFALWSLDPRARQWRRLLPEGAPGIASSRTGTLASYARLDRQISLWQLPFSGGEGRPLAPSTRVDWSPALSPDGKRLAFLSNRTGEWEIWLLDLVGGSPRRLTHFGGREVQDLHWSRDGRMIATSVASEGLFDLFLIDVETGAARGAAITAQDERQPFFAPDGRSLWFVRRYGNRFQLRSIDLASKRESMLFEGAIRAVASADGRTAYFAKPFADGLWSADLAAGSVKPVAPWPDAGRNRNVDLFSGALWATAPDGRSGIALMRIDLSSGKSSRVVGLPGIARPSGIAILGDSVIYARLQREEADLVTLRFEKRR